MSTDAAVVVTRPIASSSASPSPTPSTPSSTPSSPGSRAKFLCSYGGRILPRPSDGQLKYVGGETRVVSVPRDINFQELMKKLTSMVNGEMVLKYQVLSEDLDALVSVKSDEDLRHMLEEIDRYETAGSPRLRAFLFPLNPVVIVSPSGSVETHAPEQRYIDSINGIIRHTPNQIKQHPMISTMQSNSLASSACSSPRSPDSSTAEPINGEFFLLNHHPKGGTCGMHRVRSSPSISSISNHSQHSGSSHFAHSQYQQNYRQGHYPGYQSLKPPIDSHKSVTPDRFFQAGRPVGRTEGVKYQVEPGPPHHYYGYRQNRGNGFYTRCMPYDECSHFTDRRVIDRPRSLAGSPNSSPRYGQSGIKAWDSMSMPGRGET